MGEVLGTATGGLQSGPHDIPAAVSAKRFSWGEQGDWLAAQFPQQLRRLMGGTCLHQRGRLHRIPSHGVSSMHSLPMPYRAKVFFTET